VNRKALFTAIATTALAFSVVACTGSADDPPAMPDMDGAPDGGRPVATAPAEPATQPGSQSTPQLTTPGASTQDVQEVTIASSDAMRFTPSALTVEAGRPVRLTLRNEGQIDHDFTLSQGVPRPIKVEAKPGQSASVTFTIARPGTYQFICSKPGHAAAGMRGTITVTPAANAG
jgi:uncharacterized cupredoxin-like copper-binding protein